MHAGVVVHEELDPLHVVGDLAGREDNRDPHGLAGRDHGGVELHVEPGLALEGRRDEAVLVVAVRGDELARRVALVLRHGEGLAGHRRAALRDELRPEVVAEEAELQARLLAGAAQRELEDLPGPVRT